MREIVSEHYATVYRFCARRLGADLAEDAAQETFVIAWKSMDRFRNESSLKTWLLGISNNVCKATARKRKMEATLDKVWLESLTTESHEAEVVNLQTLKKGLAALSEDHRNAVVLHEFDGLTYEEIATVLQVPVGTVKSRLYYAFSYLRTELGDLK